MAEETGGKTYDLLSLTGYLSLQTRASRGRLFRGAKVKSFWFWFDEQLCCLKYYKNQDSYQHCLHDPVGTIDLRQVKVTPCMTVEGGAPNQFQITTESQVYLLAAKDSTAAHDWIKKLQTKRGQWIKAVAAKEDHSHERRMMHTLGKQLGGILQEGEGLGEGLGEGSSSVRKIVGSHLSKAALRSMNVDHAPHSELEMDLFRHNTLGAPLRPHPPDLHQPLQKSFSDSDGRLLGHQSLTSDPELDRNQPSASVQPPESLNKEERERLQHEHEYWQMREETTRLQREVMRLQDKVEKRDSEILELNHKLAQMKVEQAKIHRPSSDIHMENELMKDMIENYRRSMRSLDSEIELHKLQQQEHEKRVSVEKRRTSELERELNRFKAKFVRLLSSQFKVTIPSAVEDDADPMEEEMGRDLLELIKLEGGDKSEFDSYTDRFTDHYGDIYDWEGNSTTQHFLCRQLYLHYTQHEQEALQHEWEEYLQQQQRKPRGKSLLEMPGERSKRREYCHLIRKGCPVNFRPQVWTSLIDRHVGRMKEVKDTAAGKGTNYYQSLLKSRTETPASKQIRLDLFRTLPTNTHFKSGTGGAGLPKLENVLVAYSLHNKNVGYCQGMNMIAAIALLFLNEERAFWFLVAIIERILPVGYFTPGLLGAQSDQAVVRELLPAILPRVSAHLQEYGIDVTLVTFNWFLTLYIDAMPTESVLRILDCLLMEGHKILFRMCVGLLKLNERRILATSDPVTLFQFLKELARHTFDIEALFHAAFVELQQFPSRSFLNGRHQHHLITIREEWNAREKERAASERKVALARLKQGQLSLLASSLALREQQAARKHLLWECSCCRPVQGMEEAWLACGDRQQGKIGIVMVSQGLNMKVPSIDIPSRVIAVQYLMCDVVLVGTLDFVIHAIDCETRKELWTTKMTDSVLDMAATDNGTVFVALADGCVAVLQEIGHAPPDCEPLLIRIGSTSVTCLARVVNQQVWCGCGPSITVVSTETLEEVYSVMTGDGSKKIYKMKAGRQGVWVTFRSASVVCLYDTQHCVKLLEVDYTTLLPSEPKDSSVDYRITALMAVADHLWLGAGCGAITIFSLVPNVPNPSATITQLARQGAESQAQSRSQQWKAMAGVGLVGAEELSDPVEAKVEDGEEEEEEEEETQKGKSRYRATEGSYAHRRKTQFGKTLRRDRRRETGVKRRKEVGVYRLVHESSHQVVQGTNEAVRVLQALRCDGATVVVSCVHSLSEQERAVQVWRASPNEPNTWSFGYLPCSALFTDPGPEASLLPWRPRTFSQMPREEDSPEGLRQF